jgi:hypothetical protein
MTFLVLLVCLFLSVLSLAAALLLKDTDLREMMGMSREMKQR